MLPLLNCSPDQNQQQAQGAYHFDSHHQHHVSFYFSSARLIKMMPLMSLILASHFCQGNFRGGERAKLSWNWSSQQSRRALDYDKFSKLFSLQVRLRLSDFIILLIIVGPAQLVCFVANYNNDRLYFIMNEFERFKE